MLQISQCQNASSVAFATVRSLNCCKYNSSASIVLRTQHLKIFVLQIPQFGHAFYVAFATLPRPLMLQMQQFCFCDVANATHAPLVLQMPQYHRNCCIRNSGMRSRCGKCNNAGLQVLRLQHAKFFGCCICNNLCPEVLHLQQLRFLKVLHLQHFHRPKVLRMQQCRLQTVANATV